jgi:hypothetical protein
MVALKSGQFLQCPGSGFGAKPGKQGFLLVRGVPLSTYTKVVQRRLDGRRLFIRHGPTSRPFHYHAQDTQEILDPAVAILEHLDRVVKPAVGLCPDLDPHPWTILLFFRWIALDRGCMTLSEFSPAGSAVTKVACW